MESYPAGAVIICSGEVYDTSTNQLADPTTIVCTVRRADATTFTPSPVVRDSLGRYHIDVVTTASSPSGVWSFRFDGDGNNQGVEDAAFYLRAPAV